MKLGLRNTRGNYDHEKFSTQARSRRADPISKGGADDGAVGVDLLDFRGKKQGATGITTAAPYIAGQWGRGDNRL
jgi:hypothetical protein